MFLCLLVLAASLCLLLCIRAAVTPYLGSVASRSRCPIGSSGIDSPITQAWYSRCTLHEGLVHPPLLVEPWFLLADQWEGFTQASQLQGLAVTISSTSALHGGSAMQGQGGGAPTWSVAVHWVCWPWCFPGGTGQGQFSPHLCFAWGTLPELQSNLSGLLLVLGLESPR